MSIFKESFKNFVQQQFLQRLLALSTPDGFRQNAENFYGYTTQRQCVIRMSSGVDIDPGTFPDYPEEPTGIELAQRWVLEGGLKQKEGEAYFGSGGADNEDFRGGLNTVSENDISETELKELEEAGVKIDSLVRTRQQVNVTDFKIPYLKNRSKFTGEDGVYGDINARSNADDDYGMVPMPGIVDATVRTKSAYGSLREAKVNFVCHNRAQLEILEYLYMRPGFIVLLEWGFSPFIDPQSGRMNSLFPPVIPEFWQASSTFQNLHLKIRERQEEMGGNYDGMIGYVKNFEISSREDGGYDCTTELITMGDVLEGIKAGASGRTLETKEGNTRETDDLEYFLTAISEWSTTMTLEEEYDSEETDDATKDASDDKTLVNQYKEQGYLTDALQELVSEGWDQSSMYVYDPEGAKKAIEVEVQQRYKQIQESWVHGGSGGAGKQASDYKWYDDLSNAGWWADVFLDSGNPGYNIDKRKIFNEDGTEAMNLETGPIEYNVVGGSPLSGVQSLFRRFIKVSKDNPSEEQYRKARVAQLELAYKYTKANSTVINALKDENERIEKILDPFIIRKGEQFTQSGGSEFGEGEAIPLSEEGTSQSPHHYIRWDLVVFILNRFVLPSYKTQKNKSLISEFTHLIREGNSENLFNYINYANTGKTGISIPNLNKGEQEQIYFDLNEVMDVSVNPAICLLPHQIPASKQVKQIAIIGPGGQDQTIGDVGDRAIGMIYLNLDWLISSYQKMKYNEDNSVKTNQGILKWVKEVWEDKVNSACNGSHNFTVQVDSETTNIARIIDLQYQTPLQPRDCFLFDVQSTSTFLRDFNYSTSIPSALGSTIAIAAQSPQSIENLEGVTFKAFNQNVKSRFTSRGTTDPIELKNKRKSLEKELILKANQLYYYLYHIMNGKFAIISGMLENRMGVENHKTNPMTSATAFNLSSRIQTIMNTLSIQYDINHEKGGQLKNNITPPKSAIIPLKFNAKLDGISGIVIGNVFRVNPDRLPKGYQDEDIAFIVLSENQKMSSGQDWTTEISGQLILLDSANNTNKKEGKGTIITTDGGESSATGDSKSPVVDLTEERLKYLEWKINASNFPEGASGVDYGKQVGFINPGNIVTFAPRVTEPYTFKHIHCEGERCVNGQEEGPFIANGDISKINPNLLNDIANAAMKAKGVTTVSIDYARNGHRKYVDEKKNVVARHWNWTGVDVSSLNGKSIDYKEGYSEKEAYDNFMTQLLLLGYNLGDGTPGKDYEKGDRAVLGCNSSGQCFDKHHDHFHISNRVWPGAGN